MEDQMSSEKTRLLPQQVSAVANEQMRSFQSERTQPPMDLAQPKASQQIRFEEVDIELVKRCSVLLKEGLNKGVLHGSFNIDEAHALKECHDVFSELVKHCDTMQKKIRQLAAQQS
jgi:hypothetical protein